jgi:hypothetical protein
MVELRERGARVESLTMLRDTLEDFFLKQVSAAARRDTAGL